MTSCPRSAGTFFTGRSLTSFKPLGGIENQLDLIGSSASMRGGPWDFSEEVEARIV